MQISIQDGSIKRGLALPNDKWVAPVSRLTAICVRFVDCDAYPLTFIGAFSRHNGGAGIGAWSISKSGKVLREEWSVETNATVVGQLTVLSAVDKKKDSLPSIVVATTDGVLAVQSN